MTTPFSLQSDIERLAELSAADLKKHSESRAIFDSFQASLNAGSIRAAEKKDGIWQVNFWVKQGILIGFRLGELVEMSSSPQNFIDKDTYPVRHFEVHDKVRIVPGGSSVRSGAYVASSVVIMPPSYINVGAYVDSG
jgi:2,3,4,5-tetrahydropyridine-2,6-dicarboxylate N-succinyltransferase